MPRCAVCGQDNPGGFRFCGACGAPLAGPARAPAEERRLVSVLFCDLVGFTARSDQADPEDVGAMLRPYHARFRAEIERRGGTLDKFIGDGVMAVFGAPVAHEDDPERAVRCALGMLAAIEELNEARPSLDLAIRIGITTGEALVRLGPDQQTEGVVGDVVNTPSSREAVLTTSPTTPSVASPGARSTSASPVVMPTRTARSRAGRAWLSSAMAASMPRAQRTARSGSSSWATGAPNTAMTPSPMNLSRVPPRRSISARSLA
ncbi:MAG TPA: adenylate/guanylate cyclase domain-containing protein, partial [Actinomycetota bacterium]|nr:adenylate/guanylate cyclase domain-containing protein [Actinomycetota bacterium]